MSTQALYASNQSFTVQTPTHSVHKVNNNTLRSQHYLTLLMLTYKVFKMLLT